MLRKDGEVSTHPPDNGARRRIPERVAVHDVDAVHDNAQLAQVALESAHVQGLVRGKLRRHPGGDERLAGSDRAVVDVDAAHGHGKVHCRGGEG